MKSTSKASALAALSLLFLASACVHTQIERTGRMRLGSSIQGDAQLMSALPAGFEEVATLKVSADVGTAERRAKHLQRRASLLGCDGVLNLTDSGEAAQAVCVRRREPAAVVAEATRVVATPSETLVQKAAAAGPEGQALLQVLSQLEGRNTAERAWPLRWYLENYPNSPFRAEVEALFVAPVQIAVAPTAAVRTAPIAK